MSTRDCASRGPITSVYEGFWKGRTTNGNPIYCKRNHLGTWDRLLSVDRKPVGTHLARAVITTSHANSCVPVSVPYG